jgi:hypothetical protein
MSLIEDFEREYQRYHGITPKRAREQRALLSQLESRLNGTLDTVTADDFTGLLADLVESGLHVNTVRKKANMVRPFFSWMFAKGLIAGDAYMRLKAVKDPRGATGNSKPRPYKRKELDQFFAGGRGAPTAPAREGSRLAAHQGLARREGHALVEDRQARDEAPDRRHRGAGASLRTSPGRDLPTEARRSPLRQRVHRRGRQGRQGARGAVHRGGAHGGAALARLPLLGDPAVVRGDLAERAAVRSPTTSR